MAVLVVGGCEGEPPFEPPPPAPRPLLAAAVVSDPTALPGGTAALLSGSADVTVAYVSLPPGTIPDGEQATIRNPSAGATMTVAMVDGGFDPVTIAASAGDTLELDVSVTSSREPLLYAIVVPPSRSPIVVRTEPPPRKRDVPLNAAMLIVFSEPIDPVTLTEGAILLLDGATPVAGQLQTPGPAELTLSFVPLDVLRSGTEYRLMVTQAVRDLDGEALEAPFEATFTTVPPVVALTISPGAATTAVGDSVQLTAVARDSAGNVLPDRPVGWSSTDTAIVTVSAAGLARAVRSGTADIVATAEQAADTVTVSVTPLTAVVEVTAATGGIDIDPDGYTVVHLEGGTSQPVPSSGVVWFAGLAAGSHTIRLDGAGENCAVQGDNPRVVQVTTDGPTRDTARISFAVGCVAMTGSLAVTVETSGPDPDIDGFALQLDAGASVKAPSNGTIVIENLPAGDYALMLSDVRDNCTIAGENPRTVTVTAGGSTRDTTRVTFSIGCVATTGSLAVTVETSGSDPDIDGVALQLDAGAPVTGPSNGTIVIESLPAGNYALMLSDVRDNCTIAGENPRTVAITAGGGTRDTTRTTFAVACIAVDLIAFTRPDGAYPSITLATPSGVMQGSVTPGDHPAWSPDGTQLAYTAMDYCYYADYCWTRGIAIAPPNGSDPVLLTDAYEDGAAEYDAEPTWRPDGMRVAFTRGSTLHIINADGSGLTPLVSAGDAAHPAWSPDGTRIAFTCGVDICLINEDGTGLTQVTSDTARDLRPAWKPDGSQIAFSTTRFSGTYELALMAPGGGIIRVSPGTPALQAGWSPDGRALVFSTYVCDIYAGCTTRGLSVINADGTNLRQITNGRDHAPAWRP